MSPTPIPPPTVAPAGPEGPGVEIGAAQSAAPDRFTRLRQMHADTAQYLVQAKMDSQARVESVRKKRADEKDKDTIRGIALGAKMDEASEPEGHVTLTGEERQMLRWAQSSEPTVPELIQAARSRLDALGTGGAENIFDPATDPTVEVGRARAVLEGELVALQSAVLEYARGQSMDGNFAVAAEIGFGIVGDDMAHLPDWFTGDFIAQVNQADLTKDDVVEAVAGLGQVTVLRSYEPIRLKMEAAVTTKRELDQRKEKERKARTHKERLSTMEGDTYDAAIAAGREGFGRIDDRTGLFSDMHINMESRNGRYYLPLGVIASGEAFRTAYDRSATINRASSIPERQLMALQLLAENQELFEQAVQTVATRVDVNLRDWTGYNKQDYIDQYGDDNQWVAGWRANLRRMIDGYAIGMLQASTESQASNALDSAHALKRADDVARTAFEVIFGETNFITDAPPQDPFRWQAFDRLGIYFEGLSGAAAERFKNFTLPLEGYQSLHEKAIAEVRGRRERREEQKAQQQQREVEARQAIEASNQAVRQAITETMQFAEGDLARTREEMDIWRQIAQSGGDLNYNLFAPRRCLVEVTNNKDEGPMLRISDKAVRMIIDERDKCDRILANGKGDPEDLKRRLLELEVWDQFQQRLQIRCDISNSYRVDAWIPKSGLRAGRNERKFRNYDVDDRTANPFQEIEGKQTQGDRRRDGIVKGADATLGKVQARLAKLVEDSAKTKDPDELARISREFSDLRRDADRARREIKNVVYEYTVDDHLKGIVAAVYIRDQVVPLLDNKGYILRR